MSHKQIPTVASKEHVQVSYPGDTALSTSSVDYEFHSDMSQRPPILYAPSKEETAMKASRETIKMKTPEGEV